MLMSLPIMISDADAKNVSEGFGGKKEREGGRKKERDKKSENERK